MFETLQSLIDLVLFGHDARQQARGKDAPDDSRTLDASPLVWGQALQARRHAVKPGITGWAQVNGRNALTWEEKFQLDLWYVDNWSIALDLAILGRTLLQVLKREGVSAPGHATMPLFQGAEERRHEQS